jgi:hypothetical protein
MLSFNWKNPKEVKIRSKQEKARIAGILYLLIFISAGFAQGAVREVMIVSGDPSATAANILSNEGLFRAGLAADLFAFLLDAVVAILLYQLLKPAGKTLSAFAAVFRLIAHPGIGSLNLVNHYAAMAVLNGSAFAGLSGESIAYLFLDLHNMGYLIAGAFFGIHLLFLGVLIVRSSNFPSILGYLILASAAGYLIETFGMTFLPLYESAYSILVALTAVAGEGALTIWLLLKGVKKE